MIILLPVIYCIICFLLNHSWFDARYMVIFAIIGGFYDIFRELIQYKRILDIKNEQGESND